jgi:hypothetical protein
MAYIKQYINSKREYKSFPALSSRPELASAMAVALALLAKEMSSKPLHKCGRISRNQSLEHWRLAEI